MCCFGQPPPVRMDSGLRVGGGNCWTGGLGGQAGWAGDSNSLTAVCHSIEDSRRRRLTKFWYDFWAMRFPFWRCWRMILGRMSSFCFYMRRYGTIRIYFQWLPMFFLVPSSATCGQERTILLHLCARSSRQIRQGGAWQSQVVEPFFPSPTLPLPFYQGMGECVSPLKPPLVRENKARDPRTQCRHLHFHHRA